MEMKIELYENHMNIVMIYFVNAVRYLLWLIVKLGCGMVLSEQYLNTLQIQSSSDIIMECLGL